MKRPIVYPLLLMVLVAAVFSEVRNLDFVSYDDGRNVYENPSLNPVTAAHVLQFWQSPYLEVYRPLVYSAWAAIAMTARLSSPIETGAGGMTLLHPAPFHLANLLLHLLNTLLVFAILRQLSLSEAACFGGALLFGIHPAQTEPVAWITGLNDLLCGTFSFLALWLYLRGALTSREEESLRRQRLLYALATLSYALALLTKANAVAVPLMAWALDAWAVKRPFRQSARALLLWAAMAVIWIPITQAAQPLPDKDVLSPLWARPLVAGDALAFYLSKLLLPIHLGIDYGRTPKYVMSQGWGYAAWIVPCALAALAWRTRVRWPWLLAAVGVFLAGLLPVCGLTPFIFQRWSTVADRYLYLALLGRRWRWHLCSPAAWERQEGEPARSAFSCWGFRPFSTPSPGTMIRRSMRARWRLIRAAAPPTPIWAAHSTDRERRRRR